MNHIKKIFLLLFFTSLLYSCNENKETTSDSELNPEVEKLTRENQLLLEESVKKDSTISYFMKSFNEIEENLSTIKEKEKGISLNTKNAELNESTKDQIVEDINLINKLLTENREKITSLNKKLKKSNIKIDELDKMIQNLTKQIEEKDIEIASLQNQLTEAHSALKHMFEEYDVKTAEVDEQTAKLNTAWYAFGNSKELKEHGVITKEGGFIGLGKTEKLMENFNKNYFTKIDITKTNVISIYSKKAKLVTIHPSGSYKFEGQGKVDKLVITNPQEFWSTSKYLVIIVE